jgi:hypothetical protein
MPGGGGGRQKLNESTEWFLPPPGTGTCAGTETITKPLDFVAATAVTWPLCVGVKEDAPPISCPLALISNADAPQKATAAAPFGRYY